jgi:aspartate kinase
VTVWVYEGTLKLEYQAVTLSKYRVELLDDQRHIKGVSNPRVAETVFRSPQLTRRCEGRQALRHDLQVAFSVLEQDIRAVEAGRSAITQEPTDDSHATTWALHVAPTMSAWGERLSVLLLAAAAHDLGIETAPVCEEVIITSDLQTDTLPSFGTVIGADPLLQETRVNAGRLIHPLIERGIVPVAPGFIGHTARGDVTTLGRNDSDYSATVIGEALDCAEVTIYTDVDGVLSADPRIAAHTRLLPRLTYSEAARLSWFGAKVLQPRTLIPVAHRNIPVRMRNPFRPHAHGTVVGPELAMHNFL